MLKKWILQQYIGIEVNALLLFHFNLCRRAYEIYIPRSEQILNMDVFYFQMCLWYSWKLTDREKNVQCVSGQNGSLLWIMSLFCFSGPNKKVWVVWVVEKTIWWICWCNCRLERQNKPLQQNCCAKSTFRSTAYKMKRNARTSSHITGQSVYSHSSQWQMQWHIYNLKSAQQYGRQSIHEATKVWVKTDL